jgi:hypothetical protein
MITRLTAYVDVESEGSVYRLPYLLSELTKIDPPDEIDPADEQGNNTTGNSFAQSG